MYPNRADFAPRLGLAQSFGSLGWYGMWRMECSISQWT
jgi:hypothetical protein